MNPRTPPWLKVALLATGWLAYGLSLASFQAPPDFGDPLPGLSPDQLADFQFGRQQFQAVHTPPVGLGPVFNGEACVQCHSDTAIGGGSDFIGIRFGRTVDGVFDPLINEGGTLQQVNGIGNFFGNHNFVGELVPADANIVSHRLARPLFGFGLIDHISDQHLLDLQARQAQLFPATAGRAAVVYDVIGQVNRIGRFGYKCQQGSLLTFASSAYAEEMGQSNGKDGRIFFGEDCPQGDCDDLRFDPVRVPNCPTNGDPEAFTRFLTLLAPPPRVPLTADARAGAALFEITGSEAGIGCADCHLTSMHTAILDADFPAVIEFFPYSDFLLHDMDVGADEIVQADAGNHEMRTTPLWGARVRAQFMHHGRARSIAEAIRQHFGQGAGARGRFNALPPAQQAQLVAFVNSL
jgi:CxxC motif-containing protein (DUF1111 family)